MDVGKVVIASIDTEMRQSYLDYAMSVIVQRALPDARDGLKPVHRRVLYAMWDMGLRSSTRYRKSAGIVGEVLKSYHPHSETAVYDSLVRLAQEFNMRYPLVDGQGNFGSVDGDGAAAMRYTEARLTAIADELLIDIDKNTVDTQPNYDASMEEPKVLPARLPNMLLNGASGIAVGMATNIPPHNLNELCDGILCLLDNPDASVDDLMRYIPGPDFPTGGEILGRDGIKAAYATGRGRVVIRAKAHIEETNRTGRFSIIVTELPYQVNKALLQERIAELVKEGKLEGISDLRDESDRNGMRLVIELKRDAQAGRVMNNLFKHTSMQTSFGVNMVALVEAGTQPRVMTLRRSLQEYIRHRQDVIVRRAQYDLERARRRAHILEGLLIALNNVDAVIKTIRESDSTEDARQNLMAGFGLTEIQANAILDMRLGRLAALENQRIADEYASVQADIAGLESLLADPGKVLDVIRNDMAELKSKYGDERRSEIRDFSGELNDEDLIPVVDQLVTLTHRGYAKRLSHDAYRTQHRGGRGVKGLGMRDEDGIQHLLSANSHDSLLIFTNRGKVYQLKVYELPEQERTAKGMPIINYIEMGQDESVTALINIKEYTPENFLFFTTKLGRVKRVNLSQFQSVRKSGMIAITLDEADELAWVRKTSGKDDILLVTRQGLGIRFVENAARPMGRPAAGVIGIRLREDDAVIASEVVAPDADLLVASSNGFGKRTDPNQFRNQGRGGKGVTAMKLTPKTGEVVAALMIRPDQMVALINSSGQVIRIAASQVSRIGRSTQGVTLMKLGKDITVVSAAPIDQKSDSEGEDGLLPSGNGAES